MRRKIIISLWANVIKKSTTTNMRKKIIILFFQLFRLQFCLLPILSSIFFIASSLFCIIDSESITVPAISDCNIWMDARASEYKPLKHNVCLCVCSHNFPRKVLAPDGFFSLWFVLFISFLCCLLFGANVVRIWFCAAAAAACYFYCRLRFLFLVVSCFLCAFTQNSRLVKTWLVLSFFCSIVTI